MAQGRTPATGGAGDDRCAVQACPTANAIRIRVAIAYIEPCGPSQLQTRCVDTHGLPPNGTPSSYCRDLRRFMSTRTLKLSCPRIASHRHRRRAPSDWTSPSPRFWGSIRNSWRRSGRPRRVGVAARMPDRLEPDPLAHSRCGRPFGTPLRARRRTRLSAFVGTRLCAPGRRRLGTFAGASYAVGLIRTAWQTPAGGSARAPPTAIYWWRRRAASLR